MVSPIFFHGVVKSLLACFALLMYPFLGDLRPTLPPLLIDALRHPPSHHHGMEYLNPADHMPIAHRPIPSHYLEDDDDPYSGNQNNAYFSEGMNFSFYNNGYP